jgi:membrane protein implicated in regulation of membrane protease activity
MGQLITPLLALIGGLMTTPLGLLAAIALGPVILGVLCAVAFGLVVFAAWSGLVGVAMLARRGYQSLSRRQRDRSREVELPREA